MRKSVIALSVAMAVAGLNLAAPASAAPAGPADAKETISKLEADGYRVITTKVGSGSIDNCSVKGVRPGRDVTDVRNTQRGNTEEIVRYTTVYVDLACAG